MWACWSTQLQAEASQGPSRVATEEATGASCRGCARRPWPSDRSGRVQTRADALGPLGPSAGARLAAAACAGPSSWRGLLVQEVVWKLPQSRPNQRWTDCRFHSKLMSLDETESGRPHPLPQRRIRAVGPFCLGVRPPPIGYSTFNRLCLESYVLGFSQGGAETEPSPDWRRSHSGVFLQLRTTARVSLSAPPMSAHARRYRARASAPPSSFVSLPACPPRRGCSPLWRSLLTSAARR